VKVGIVSDVPNNVAAVTYGLAHLADSDVLLNLGYIVLEYCIEPALAKRDRRRAVC
jgi:hypothetical protein